MLKDSVSTVGNSFSTVQAPQWIGGIASVQQNDSLSAMEIIQYSGGIKSVNVKGQHQYMQGG